MPFLTNDRNKYYTHSLALETYEYAPSGLRININYYCDTEYLWVILFFVDFLYVLIKSIILNYFRIMTRD